MTDEIPEGYTRVSEVLKFFNPGKYKTIHPALEPLLGQKAQEMMKRLGFIHELVLFAKCHLGTNVHKAIEDFFNHIPYKLEGKEIGYFESFKKWHEKHNMKPISQEERHNDPINQISGKFDGLMQWGSQAVLVDYKTSYEVDAQSWMMQGAFYCWLAGLPLGQEVHFVQLKSDGSEAFPFVFVYDDALEISRNHCLTAYRYWNPLIP